MLLPSALPVEDARSEAEAEALPVVVAPPALGPQVGQAAEAVLAPVAALEMPETLLAAMPLPEADSCGTGLPRLEPLPPTTTAPVPVPMVGSEPEPMPLLAAAATPPRHPEALPPTTCTESAAPTAAVLAQQCPSLVVLRVEDLVPAHQSTAEPVSAAAAPASAASVARMIEVDLSSSDEEMSPADCPDYGGSSSSRSSSCEDERNRHARPKAGPCFSDQFAQVFTLEEAPRSIHVAGPMLASQASARPFTNGVFLRHKEGDTKVGNSASAEGSQAGATARSDVVGDPAARSGGATPAAAGPPLDGPVGSPEAPGRPAAPLPPRPKWSSARTTAHDAAEAAAAAEMAPIPKRRPRPKVTLVPKAQVTAPQEVQLPRTPPASSYVAPRPKMASSPASQFPGALPKSCAATVTGRRWEAPPPPPPPPAMRPPQAPFQFLGPGMPAPPPPCPHVRVPVGGGWQASPAAVSSLGPGRDDPEPGPHMRLGTPEVSATAAVLPRGLEEAVMPAAPALEEACASAAEEEVDEGEGLFFLDVEGEAHLVLEAHLLGDGGAEALVPTVEDGLEAQQLPKGGALEDHRNMEMEHQAYVEAMEVVEAAGEGDAGTEAGAVLMADADSQAHGVQLTESMEAPAEGEAEGHVEAEPEPGAEDTGAEEGEATAEADDAADEATAEDAAEDAEVADGEAAEEAEAVEAAFVPEEAEATSEPQPETDADADAPLEAEEEADAEVWLDGTPPEDAHMVDPGGGVSDLAELEAVPEDAELVVEHDDGDAGVESMQGWGAVELEEETSMQDMAGEGEEVVEAEAEFEGTVCNGAPGCEEAGEPAVELVGSDDLAHCPESTECAQPGSEDLQMVDPRGGLSDLTELEAVPEELESYSVEDAEFVAEHDAEDPGVESLQGWGAVELQEDTSMQEMAGEGEVVEAETDAHGPDCGEASPQDDGEADGDGAFFFDVAGQAPDPSALAPRQPAVSAAALPQRQRGSPLAAKAWGPVVATGPLPRSGGCTGQRQRPRRPGPYGPAGGRGPRRKAAEAVEGWPDGWPGGG